MEGRFISKDPAGDVDGPNLYIYVLNNPIMYFDSFGLSACPCDCETQKKCSGTARVLKGNDKLFGKSGAFGVAVTSGSAAVIPSQWGTNKAGLRPYLSKVCGSCGERRIFTGITDVIGGKVPKNPCKASNVRDALECLNPGALIIEVPGGSDLGTTNINIVIPKAMSCPTGTGEVPCKK
jgi:hypothetical protein